MAWLLVANLIRGGGRRPPSLPPPNVSLSDLDRFTPSGPRAARNSRHRILSLGRLVERKDVETTIRALPEVPGAELVIAGGGDANAELARLTAVAQACGVRNRVHLAGQIARQDVPALLRSADVVVSVPWYEPFGMVPLEAMACGVPVVASAVGGHLDTILDGRTGALVSPHDPLALAQRLRELLADPGRLAAIGSAAAARARSRYGWGRIASETELLYCRVMPAAETPAAPDPPAPDPPAPDPPATVPGDRS